MQYYKTGLRLSTPQQQVFAVVPTLSCVSHNTSTSHDTRNSSYRCIYTKYIPELSSVSLLIKEESQPHFGLYSFYHECDVYPILVSNNTI